MEMQAMIPGYWMHETSGALRSAVEAYLGGRPMTDEHIAARTSGDAPSTDG
ncbi:hypothetical protein J4G43_047120 [Bradyrhizobium barranii subsp. barranii]|uniref:Uncharacterized protein n=1 Tax=Bradyrhizobium barranii subsp. barranii TaxID=2823807 RepID=A0A939MEH1_9BRAD|nr:hypothetical protein [Bradyrhizobium barranii]UEM11939.1 hypothetical protein J4G43_047120 [Bradyrhizobium barranii subsp. barranii]